MQERQPKGDVGDKIRELTDIIEMQNNYLVCESVLLDTISEQVLEQ